MAVVPAGYRREEARLEREAVVVVARPVAVADLVEEAAVQIAKPEVMVGLVVAVVARLVLVGNQAGTAAGVVVVLARLVLAEKAQ